MLHKLKQSKMFYTVCTLPIQIGALVVLVAKMHTGTADSRTAGMFLLATAVFVGSIAQDRANNVVEG